MNSKAVLMRRFVVLWIVSLVFLAGCGSGTSQSFNSQPPPPGGSNPTPTITTISPNSVVAGTAAGFTLAVNGTNFLPTSTVNFGGTARTTTFVSSTQLTAAIPAAAIASAGTVPVTVTNPAPGGGTSNAVNFTTTSGTNPIPMITTISPSSAAAGGAAFTLMVNGTNFVSASVVDFGGTPRTTTFVSATQLTAAIPAAAIASAGTVPVTVTNPAPGGGTSNAVNFAITSGTNPIPTINALYPSGAPVGGPGFTLTVFGSNFVASSVVRWNGADRLTEVVNSDWARAQIPASDIAATGTATISVFNPTPGGGSSNSSTFTIASGGECPQSVAVDPAGKFAYVANSTCGGFLGTVSMYTINPTSGALTSTGRVAADFCPFSVTVDPLGRFAYVANFGLGCSDAYGDASVSMYSVNPTNGALTSIGSPVLAYSCANSVTVDPSGKFVYVPFSACGDDVGGVAIYTINSTTGALALIGRTIAGIGITPLWVAVHPTGKFAYVANAGYAQPNFGSVSMYTLDATTGVLTSSGEIAAGSSPTLIAIDPSGKFAYVTNSGSNDVSIYTINATTGALTPTEPIAAGRSPASVAVGPTGKFAYVANSGSNDVSMYTIDAATGVLSPMGTIATGLSPTSIAIDPSGKFAYVANSGSNNVSMYSIDAATGALTLIGTIGT